jgi:peptidoglycan/LPS O-acetylase OafA/YrhL
MNVILGLGTFCALLLATAMGLRLFPTAARAVLGDDPPDRVASLDGLRGVLAICVFLHHSILAQAYYAGRPWQPPKSNFDNLLGRGAVAMFFMVSAYLFWGRVVRNRGKLNWISFFYGRVLRLAPMFYTAVGFLLLIVAVETHFTLRVSMTDLAKQIGCWSAFGFLGIPDINGLKDTYTILSTLWTLKYEWIFYFSLPVLALIYRLIGWDWPIYPAVFALAMWLGHEFGEEWRLLAYFAMGFLAVHCVKPAKFRWVWGISAIVAILILCIYFHDERGPIQPLLMLPIFIAALQSTGPWAIMRRRPLRFLGHISYSVYLLHNPLIHILAKWGIGLARYGALNQFQFYGVVFAMGLAIIAISTITFVLIEKPFFTAKNRTSHSPAALAMVSEQAAP